MNEYWHQTLRHYGTLLIGAIVLTVLGFSVLQHIAPPPKAVNAPTAVFTPSPVEHETQALIDALQTVAQSTATKASPLQQPAIAVIRDTGLVKGLSDAQIAQILSALKPKTAQKVDVGTTVVGPSPKPYTGTDTSVYQADYAATVQALHDTHIQTSVSISQQEVPPSRIGSIIASSGTGVSYALIRKHQYEFDLGLVQPNAGAHLTGTAALVYDLPHTSLGLGPAVVYNHGLKYGISAVVHF